MIGVKRVALKVVENKPLDKNGIFFHLFLDSPLWERWDPGQFVMIRPINWIVDPFLPRPFSIADVDEYLHIYYQVVGKGTKLISSLKPDDRVLVWGPLGKGFKFRPTDELLLLSGGMGIVPFLGLINHHPNPDKLELIFGHRHPLYCYPFEYISKKILTWNIMDSAPKDLEKLKKAIKVKIENYARDGKVFACGPEPFLKMVHEFVIKYRANAQFSLETVMACGIGACLGCAIAGKNKRFVQVCKEGPVFSAKDITL